MILVVMGCLWACFEVFCIAANTVFGGLVNDIVPQAVIGRFFGLFRAISLVAGMIFYFRIMGKAESYFMWIFIGIGVLYGVGFILMCLNLKEGDYPPPPAVAGRSRLLPAFRSYLKDSYGCPYYLLFFAASILSGLASNPFNIYSLFYAKSLGVSLDAFGIGIALTYAISLALAYPLGALADRFHPLFVNLVALALYAGAMVWGAFTVRNSSTYLVALVLHGVMSGIIATAGASISQRLLPRSKFTEISSAGGVLNSLMLILVAPAMGAVLDAYGHAYRLTFVAGFLIAVAALVVNFSLYRKFIAMGGAERYIAPE